MRFHVAVVRILPSLVPPRRIRSARFSSSPFARKTSLALLPVRVDLSKYFNVEFSIARERKEVEEKEGRKGGAKNEGDGGSRLVARSSACNKVGKEAIMSGPRIKNARNSEGNGPLGRVMTGPRK